MTERARTPTYERDPVTYKESRRRPVTSVTRTLLPPDRRLESTPVEARIAAPDPLDVELEIHPHEVCPVCGWTERAHAEGVWDVHRDVWERRARHAGQVEARNARRLCRDCGMVHGPGACP